MKTSFSFVSVSYWFFSVFLLLRCYFFLCNARPKRKTLFSIRHSFFGPVIVFFHHFLLYTFMLEMLLLLFPFIIFFVAFIHCQLFSSALWTFFQYRFAWMFCFLALSHFISRLSILCCCCYFFVCKLTLFAVYVLYLLFLQNYTICTLFISTQHHFGRSNQIITRFGVFLRYYDSFGCWCERYVFLYCNDADHSSKSIVCVCFLMFMFFTFRSVRSIWYVHVFFLPILLHNFRLISVCVNARWFLLATQLYTVHKDPHIMLRAKFIMEKCAVQK